MTDSLPPSPMLKFTRPLWRLLVIYLVLSVQLSSPVVSSSLDLSDCIAAAHWLMIVAAWCLLDRRNRHGGWWVLLIGLLIDLTSQHRIGLHLATCGALAAILQVAFADRKSPAWWHLPLVAGWLTFGDAVISRTILMWTRIEPLNPSLILIHAARICVPTVLVSLILIALIHILRRLLHDPDHRRPLELQNQWARLAED